MAATYEIQTNGRRVRFDMVNGHIKWTGAEQCDGCGRALDEDGEFRAPIRGNYPKPARIACPCGSEFPAVRI